MIGRGGVRDSLRRELRQADVESLLRDLVGLQTHENEAPVVDYLTARFSTLGVPCHTTSVDGETRSNLVVRWGQGSRSLVFNTHMDTVPIGGRDLWSHDPHGGEIAAGRLYGRGAADAKGSLAAMVAAFEALVRCGHKTNGVLTLTAVACEETRGRGTRVAVSDGLQAEAAVVGEPTDLQVHIAHKGLIRFRIITRGRSAHASSPARGANAIAAMALVIQDLEKLGAEVASAEDSLLGHASLTITRVEGGQADNVVPEACAISVDRRLLPGETLSQVTEQTDRVAQAACHRYPGVSLETLVTHDLAAARTGPQEEIVECALRSRDAVVGDQSRPQGFPACCDMIYLSQAGIPTVILGPGRLAQAHVADEYVSLAQVAQAAEVYALLAYDWLSR